MDKNVVGDWGANLSDRDYGRALAALGVLEATGTQQHGASADPEAILAALSVTDRPYGAISGSR